MAINNQNFNMFAGNTKRIVVTVMNEAGTDPENLTGASVRWAMKQSAYSPQSIIVKDPDNDTSITDALAGKATILIRPEDTQGLVGAFYHEAEVTDKDGNVSTVLTGTVTINKSGM